MAPTYKSSEYVGANDMSDSDSDSEVSFQPPKHYHKVPSSSSSSSFKSSLNKNKQVWLIKTPKGFPLSKLKSLPVSFTSTSISNGPKPLTLDNTNYQVNEEMLSADSEVRKYSLINNNKVLSDCKIDRFYQVRELVDIPSINYDSVVIPRSNVRPIKNLRMRHFPTGYTANDYDEANPELNSDSDIEQQPTNTTVDSDGKVTKKSKVDESQKKEKKEKKDKKDKKDKKEKKDKKDKKDKKH